MKDITPEMIAQLRAPLPPQAITQHPTKTYLSSIKPPYVIERLNEVFGLNGWRDEYEIIQTVINKKASAKKGEYEVLTVVARGVLTMPEYGIVRTAYGGNDQEDFGDAYKGACTDCLTKMASMLYIGADVYKGLGTKSEATKPAARVDYQTIEGILEDKKADEHGYWFKIGDRAIFKDEQSPADVSPIWDSPTGLKFRLRVIERKRGEKTFYEFVEVLGEPGNKPDSDVQATVKPEPVYDTSQSQEAPI